MGARDWCHVGGLPCLPPSCTPGKIINFTSNYFPIEFSLSLVNPSVPDCLGLSSLINFIRMCMNKGVDDVQGAVTTAEESSFTEIEIYTWKN